MVDLTHRRLGIPLSIFFFILAFSEVIGQYGSKWFSISDPDTFNIIFVVIDLILAVCILLIALNNKDKEISSSNIAVWAFFGLELLYAINILCHVLTEESFSSLIGISTQIVLPLIYALFSALFLISLKTWTAIKIIGILATVPGIIVGILWYNLLTSEEFDGYYSVFNIVEKISLAATILYSVCLILSIVWTCTKSKECDRSMQNVQINEP